MASCAQGLRAEEELGWEQAELEPGPGTEALGEGGRATARANSCVPSPHPGEGPWFAGLQAVVAP